MLQAKTHISVSVVAIVALCAVLPHFAGGDGYAYAAARPKAPTSVKVTAEKAHQLKVTWRKVSGASGYIVYMAKRNMTTGRIGKYKKVKTIRKRATVSYTKKNLKAGTKYYFRIKAYKGNAKSKFSKAKAAYAEPKTAFDKPYDKAAIIEDAKAYGDSIGMTWSEPLTKDNCSWEAPPRTSPTLSGKRLKRLVKTGMQRVKKLQADNGYNPGEFHFNLYFEPVGDGEYKLYFLCG
jgi:hypothetical protein